MSGERRVTEDEFLKDSDQRHKSPYTHRVSFCRRPSDGGEWEGERERERGGVAFVLKSSIELI